MLDRLCEPLIIGGSIHEWLPEEVRNYGRLGFRSKDSYARRCLRSAWLQISYRTDSNRR